MESIIEPTIDYDFSKLYLGPPSTLAGGSYFTRIMYTNNKPLYIQTPKSLTKQGFIKSGKKIYVDLMFDNNDTVFINWIENLESNCQRLIFDKSESWFEGKLENNDIDSAFTSPFKIFKSGKYYLLRVNVKPNIKIYNETDLLLNIEEITDDKHLISILEIQGIKFTSRNFQIEIELKQTMVVSPDPFLDECFIKKPIKKNLVPIDNNLDEFINESIKEIVKKETENKVESGTIVSNESETKELEKVSVTSEHIKSVSKELENINLQIYSPKEVNFDLNDNTLEEEIILDVEDLNPKVIEIEDPNLLKEFDIMAGLESNLETVTLKKPNQVYYEIYQKAREKAKEAKKNAILAYLEAKSIKKTYMLDNINESDSDEELDEINSNDSDQYSQISENDLETD